MLKNFNKGKFQEEIKILYRESCKRTKELRPKVEKSDFSTKFTWGEETVEIYKDTKIITTSWPGFERFFLKDKEVQMMFGNLAARIISQESKNLPNLESAMFIRKSILPSIKNKCGYSKLKLKPSIRVFQSAIWKELNPQALKITLKATGYSSRIYDYNFITERLEDAEKLMQKTPGVVAFAAAMNRKNSFAFQNLGIVESAKLILKHLKLEEPKYWKFLCHMKPLEIMTMLIHSGVLNDPVIKTDSNKNSVGPGFELVTTKVNDPWVVSTSATTTNLSLSSTSISIASTSTNSTITRTETNPFTDSYETDTNYVDTSVRTLQKMLQIFIQSSVPRLSILRGMLKMSQFQLLTGAQSETASLFVKQVVEFTRNKKGIKGFWDKEGSPIIDWLSSERIALDSNQRKAPFAWYKRNQEEWHRQFEIQRQQERARYAEVNRVRLENEKKARAELIWTSAVEEFEVDGYKVIPLTTGVMLDQESDNMQHCVRTYAHQCIAGVSRIFSIKKIQDPIQHIATFEISKKSTGWYLAQIKGVKNAQVESQFKKIAENVVKMYDIKDPPQQKMKVTTTEPE